MFHCFQSHLTKTSNHEHHQGCSGFFSSFDDKKIQHTKDFCEKNLPKLSNFEGKFSEIAVFRIVSSGLSRYSRILRFFLLFPSDMWPNLLAPLVDIAKSEHPGLMSVASVFFKCYQMSNRPVLGGYEKKVRTRQGFIPVLILNPSGYQGNPAAILLDMFCFSYSTCCFVLA
jgi:hypothetical protein